MELGDSQIGFQTAEEATQGFSSGYSSVSQAGLSSRAGAQTAPETMTGEVEMANLGPEPSPYDIFANPASSAEATTMEQSATEQIIGEININEAGVMETTMYATPEIVPATEAVGATTAEVAGMSSLEIGGEAVAVAETAGAVGAGVGAGILAGATAIATAGVATVGALGYFASHGLFDFDAQANAFQKGDYNTEQEVATLTPPKLKYVPPAFNSMDQASVMAYLQAKDQAQADYQKALADYNVALAKQQTAGAPTP
jgi:hypothetical protein